MQWLQNLRKLMSKSNSKNRISVDMREEERAALNEAAQKVGMTLSEFVRGAVGDAVRRIQMRNIAERASGNAIDGAFAALDESDLTESLVQEPPKPAPEPAYTPTFAESLTRHPCAHLNSWTPPNYKLGEIPGTCGRQGLKPCHFHGNSARNCPLFTPYFTRKS